MTLDGLVGIGLSELVEEIEGSRYDNRGDDGVEIDVWVAVVELFECVIDKGESESAPGIGGAESSDACDERVRFRTIL